MVVALVVFTNLANLVLVPWLVWVFCWVWVVCSCGGWWCLLLFLVIAVGTSGWLIQVLVKKVTSHQRESQSAGFRLALLCWTMMIMHIMVIHA